MPSPPCRNRTANIFSRPLTVAAPGCALALMGDTKSISGVYCRRHEILVRLRYVRARAAVLRGRLPAGPGSLVNEALASTTLTSLQAFNLGLPVTYQHGFGDGASRSTEPTVAGYVQDRWKAKKTSPSTSACARGAARPQSQPASGVHVGGGTAALPAGGTAGVLARCPSAV